MKYLSTKGECQATLDDALLQGIAADGGLFLPESLPQFKPEAFATDGDIKTTANTLLSPFFAGSELATELPAIVAETFRFDIPVSALPVTTGCCKLLELYHGPTAAFKDVGAAFLAACLSRLKGDEDNPITILVATSGDTGGAVAAAFDGRPGMRVVVLYPDSMVSDRQMHQLTCWSDNVLSLAVQGTFDDCQSIVKSALADQALSARHRFSSANSINIGRLLPQAIYYAHASTMHWSQTGNAPGFIVPTGNLGNAFACFLARAMGLPIGDIILATNANRVIKDFLDDGVWNPRASIATLASAMDVGNPSNMERLRYLESDVSVLGQNVGAVSVTDAEISAQIKDDFANLNLLSCPHTATATYAWSRLSSEQKQAQDWILVATAHAAKFEQIVEPLIGSVIELPDVLAEILERPSRFVRIPATMSAFESILAERFG